MRNITLISTYHAEAGRCNVTNLRHILELAQPEVIFLEIPLSFFDHYFKDKSRSNLESKAVNLYLEMQHAELVPVDVFEVGENFFEKSERIFQKVEGVSVQYKMLMDQHSYHVRQHGFAYLNSKYCSDFWSSLYAVVKVEIEGAGDKELSKTFQHWKDVMERRERAMMQNIQKYSEANVYAKGVFLAGAAHRGSFIEKSEHLSTGSAVTLEWNFDSYDGLVQ